jgi:hypothetical protein
MSRCVRLAAQSRLGRRSECVCETAIMAPKPRVEFAGGRVAGGGGGEVSKWKWK